jgi:S-formylglutathione hydrolase FrmB
MQKQLKIVLSAIVFILTFNTLLAQKKGEFKLIDVPSPSLKNCLIDAKEVQKVAIYLPPSYNESKKMYPVVYFLTGYTAQPGQYPPTNWIDSIMGNLLVNEMIYVEISGFNRFKGTMYANSPVTGNWEDFVTKDVISFIDKNYRTLAKRESRGIAGHSMGGAGCFNISLKYANLFSVAYPMSPAISAQDSLMHSMFGNERSMKALESLSKKMSGVPDDKFAEKLSSELAVYGGAIDWVLGYGYAFAPDVSQPLKMNLPYDILTNGKLQKNDKIWKLWEQGFGSIDEKVKLYKNNLLKYRHFSLDAGYDDLKWIYTSTLYISRVFAENRVPFSMHLFDGDHVNRVSEQMANRVMPIMSTYLLKE